MVKTLLGQIREYKKISLIAPLLTAMEVFLELLIPYVTASIIDKGINAGNLSQIYLYGGIMLILAFFSLLTGALSGKFSAIASAGLPATCGTVCMRTYRPLHFLILTSTAQQVW